MSRFGACLVGLASACSAYAAPFADPTRPPRELEGPRAGAGAPGAPRLESVLIAPDRRIAVISGQSYIEGAPFADGRVLRISETEVVIRRPARDEVVKLFPQAGKQARPGVQQRK
jgi:MSHA biogenesis protein MshK